MSAKTKSLELKDLNGLFASRSIWDTTAMRPLGGYKAGLLEKLLAQAIDQKKLRETAALSFELGRRQFGVKTYLQTGLPHFSSLKRSGYRERCETCTAELNERYVYYQVEGNKGQDKHLKARSGMAFEEFHEAADRLAIFSLEGDTYPFFTHETLDNLIGKSSANKLLKAMDKLFAACGASCPADPNYLMVLKAIEASHSHFGNQRRPLTDLESETLVRGMETCGKSQRYLYVAECAFELGCRQSGVHHESGRELSAKRHFTGSLPEFKGVTHTPSFEECPECEGPIMEVEGSLRDGTPWRSYLPHPVSNDFIKATKKLLSLKLNPEALDGDSGYQPTQADREAPFFSEAYLYCLVGKDEARSIRGALRQFLEAAGLPEAWKYL